MNPHTCYVCGNPITRESDSSLHLEIEAGVMPRTALLMLHDKHVLCSPSRAQWIMDERFGHRVVDDRPEYDKRRMVDRYEWEERYSSAWARLKNAEEAKGI